MKRPITEVSLAVLAAAILASPCVRAEWIKDGVALCTASGASQWPHVASDGAGGAIVVWHDNRSGNNDIYAQRIDASGAALWTADGVGIRTASGDQNSPRIVSDGVGGAIITWQDYSPGHYNIYAQRVNASGTVLWSSSGVGICTAALNQGYPDIVSDGAGGAIITWYDYRSGDCDVYAQRIDASGTVQWVANGVALCTATGVQAGQRIVSDGAEGAIVAWEDHRSGNADVYAQKITAAGYVLWTPNGVALCTATGDQKKPEAASDGAGGVIVTWADERSGGLDDIYAQRVSSAGAVSWTPDGVAVCTAAYTQLAPAIVSDGAGGAIVAWQDARSTVYDIYAQRIGPAGSVMWTANGVVLCAAAGSQFDPAIAADGEGGAVVTWGDERSGEYYDIYAQKVNAVGATRWLADGVPICTAANDQYSQVIATDGAGGGVIAWIDLRYGSEDCFAQSVNTSGIAGFLPPVIVAVRDVPADQGGWARLTIGRPSIDAADEMEHPAASYNVWQRVDDPALLARLAAVGKAASMSGLSVAQIDERRFVQSKELIGASSFPPGTWELLGSFAAYQQVEYRYLASTVADSSARGVPYSVYLVSVHTPIPSIWFLSRPDSGYSVDNLPPETPVGLAAVQSYAPVGLALSWGESSANDFARFAVYRGASVDFVPGPENLIATPVVPEYFDATWRWSGGYSYKISAIDVHDNQSGFAPLSPDNITGGEAPAPPAASYLAQNYPNPFNPSTRIDFGLATASRVSLRIYDAAGRLVRRLVHEELGAGTHSVVWDGRNDSGSEAESGIYFYRLDAGLFSETRKLALMK